MAYATYVFYTDTYKGNAIASADFDRLATRASSYIDHLTLGRASSYSAGDEVKMAACSVAEVLDKEEKGGELASQTVGSWSRSYVTSGKTLDQRLYDAVKLYLAYTGLLYGGIYCVRP